MKKIIMLILIVVLITSSAYANKFSEIDSVELKDSKTNQLDTYQPINLILKGQDVITDVPGILYTLDGQSRTLVPVRFITEELGAEVSWEQETETAVIQYQDKNIRLTIDSSTAMINGEEVSLPSGVPAKLMSYNNLWRTMVPIRFISESFDLDIDWVEDTKTVTISNQEQKVSGIDFKYKKKFPEIRLKTTGYVDVNSYVVGGNASGIDSQMIFSIPNTTLSLDDFEESIFLTKDNGTIDYDISLFDVKNLIISEQSGDIKGVNVQLNLNKNKGFNTFYDNGTNELVIQFINSVDKIYTDNIYNSKALIIKTREEQPAITVSQENQKVYIDVVNSNLQVNPGEKTTINVGSGGIESYTYYQLDTNTVALFDSSDQVTRVELNLTSDKSVEDVYIEEINNEIFAYVSGNPLNGFEYVKNAQGRGSLEINFLEAGTYNLSFDDKDKILELVFDDHLVDIDDMNLDIDDQIVKWIDISKTMGQYVVKFALEAPVTLDEQSSSGELTSSINLAFNNLDIINSKYNDKLIVIDPGHGGRDPGAIGSLTGTTESELVLKAGLKLQKKLESKGFKTYITRDDNRYVDLYQRPNIANKLNADLFVSIHINAFSSPTAQGIEVLYKEDASRDNKSFAKNMQGYLLSYLNGIDRGIKNRPRLVVLKNTMMPAVLAELGFLTNADEEQLLIRDEYLEKAANAMYRSIIDQIN